MIEIIDDCDNVSDDENEISAGVDMCDCYIYHTIDNYDHGADFHDSADDDGDEDDSAYR